MRIQQKKARESEGDRKTENEFGRGRQNRDSRDRKKTKKMESWGDRKIERGKEKN